MAAGIDFTDRQRCLAAVLGLASVKDNVPIPNVASKWRIHDGAYNSVENRMDVISILMASGLFGS